MDFLVRSINNCIKNFLIRNINTYIKNSHFQLPQSKRRSLGERTMEDEAQRVIDLRDQLLRGDGARAAMVVLERGLRDNYAKKSQYGRLIRQGRYDLLDGVTLVNEFTERRLVDEVLEADYESRHKRSCEVEEDDTSQSSRYTGNKKRSNPYLHLQDHSIGDDFYDDVPADQPATEAPVQSHVSVQGNATGTVNGIDPAEYQRYLYQLQPANQAQQQLSMGGGMMYNPYYTLPQLPAQQLSQHSTQFQPQLPAQQLSQHSTQFQQQPHYVQGAQPQFTQYQLQLLQQQQQLPYQAPPQPPQPDY